jgi:hypothetical protein
MAQDQVAAHNRWQAARRELLELDREHADSR